MTIVWQAVSSDQQSLDGATSAYVVLVALGAGAGAFAFGVHLRRQLKAADPVPRPTDRRDLRDWKTNRVLDRATPYFLMFWGVGFFIGGLVQAVTALSR